MKLSEAILRGSTLIAPKAGGQYFNEERAGCALGMAVIAKGYGYRRSAVPVSANKARTLGVEGVFGVWILAEVRRPCNCWWFTVPREMPIKDIVAHLFDQHVMEKKNWTLNQLVAWVQTLEPEETVPVRLTKSIPYVKTISSGVSVDRRHEELEWQRVLQAFESRHKARKARHDLGTTKYISCDS
jgi:hypothetical protein